MQAKSDLAFVEGVLRRWDPIGVNDPLAEEGLPLNEYDSYASHVLEMLRNGYSEQEIRSYLEITQSEGMGMGPMTPAMSQAAEQVAGELVSWWRAKPRSVRGSFAVRHVIGLLLALGFIAAGVAQFLGFWLSALAVTLVMVVALVVAVRARD